MVHKYKKRQIYSGVTRLHQFLNSLPSYSHGAVNSTEDCGNISVSLTVPYWLYIMALPAALKHRILKLHG
jgi:hypothetical protein